MEDAKEIPEELVVEILARMPVKSLIKFTCVCKSWLSLIKSHKFASKQYSTRTQTLSNQNLHDCHFFINFWPERCAPMGEISLLSYETLDTATRFQCKPVKPLLDFGCGYSWSLEGPCNGIFCLSMCKAKPRDLLLLWNPSTRQIFKTAQPKCGINNDMGLGFDANTNDFKIVAFDTNYERGPFRIQLYSLAANSWRDIKDSPITFGQNGFLINHLDPSSNGRMCNWLGFSFLLSFDMVDEVFIKTPIPDGIIENILNCAFVQQRSHLLHPAIITYGLDDSDSRVSYVNVWDLHEYGAAGYWTKKLSVLLPEHIIFFRPKGFWKDDTILFMNNTKERVLTCYNYITQELKTVDSFYVDFHQQLTGFAESLFPIQTLSHPLGECKDSDHGPEYSLCEVNQPLCANSCIFRL